MSSSSIIANTTSDLLKKTLNNTTNKLTVSTLNYTTHVLHQF